MVSAPLAWVFIVMVLAGTIPVLAGSYQALLSGFHAFRRRPGGPFDPATAPRVSIIVPAWNEAAVIERTLEALMLLDYPQDRLRVYVVDDASTDATPDIVSAKALQHPGSIFLLTRLDGGQGKAHTINHGIAEIREEAWHDAILVMDADVIFTPSSLRRMARHLADPAVGAVTAYIKEGSRPANYLNRFVSFEYVTAQAMARRAQNVLGVHACLAGGAQLVRRTTLEQIGGVVDTTTLAEDTITTFRIQLTGQHVVFEPHAVVWAEEPRRVAALWKQRVRWGRGNVQVTKAFRSVWFRRGGGRLGGGSFGVIWFSIFLMPCFMVGASIGLVGLFLCAQALGSTIFHVLVAVNVVTYGLVTLTSLAIDPPSVRAAWREALAFPGLISVATMLYVVYPALLERILPHAIGFDPPAGLGTGLLLFSYLWVSGSMLGATLIHVLGGTRLGFLEAPLLYLVGYGPLLCTITVAAYWREARGAEMRWEKTEKVGVAQGLT